MVMCEDQLNISTTTFSLSKWKWRETIVRVATRNNVCPFRVELICACNRQWGHCHEHAQAQAHWEHPSDKRFRIEIIAHVCLCAHAKLNPYIFIILWVLQGAIWSDMRACICVWRATTENDQCTNSFSILNSDRWYNKIVCRMKQRRVSRRLVRNSPGAMKPAIICRSIFRASAYRKCHRKSNDSKNRIRLF